MMLLIAIALAVATKIDEVRIELVSVFDRASPIARVVVPSDLEIDGARRDDPAGDRGVEMVEPRLSLVPLGDHPGATGQWTRLDDGTAAIDFRVDGALAAGEVRGYRIALDAAASLARASRVGEDVSVVGGDGGERLRYRGDVVAPPDGVDPVYARSGYIHPLRTPLARVVTGDFPAAHRHQHGVFFAWTRTRHDGRSVDFWNAAERQGRVEHERLTTTWSGAVHAGFRASLRHVDRTGPGEPEVVLRETWDVRVFPGAGATVVDLESTQIAEDSLVLLEYHYGGFAWRGPAEWTADRVEVTTDVTSGQADADGARVAYCAVTATVADGVVTLAILAHPENPRSPEPIRFHPDEPYFCFATCRLGEERLDPGVARVCRYRLVAVDGSLDRAALDALARDYRAPLVGSLVRE